jgi:hypothetical protein
MSDDAGDFLVTCPQTRQVRPCVCQPLWYYRDPDMTQRVVICAQCQQEQPGGAAAVRAYYSRYQAS